ncbi:MAG: hypothetical protein JW941_07995, partial [Candidatus Coatesbacteria bacterium]|nr:hypothetical protein [Candidatus Coatesbacteria bacterium]
EEFLALAHDLTDIDEKVAASGADIILFATSYLMRFYSGNSLPVVLDLAANIELEAVFTPGSDFSDVIMGRLDQYARADFFIIGSPRQLPWYTPFWILAGLDIQQRHFTIIPICCSPDLPPIPERDEPSFICAGMFYPWQDPFDAQKELLSTLDAAKKGEFTIFTGKHPTWQDINTRLIDPRMRLGNSERLKVRGFFPFSEITTEWAKYGCAIDVMKQNLERALANPMRTTTYLWLGIPVIVSNFYWISELIEHYDAGWLVDPLEKGAVRRITESILRDPQVLRPKALNAQRLVRENLTWDKCVEGLDEFCKSPSKLERANTLIAVVAEEMARLSAEHIAIAKETGRIHGEVDFWRDKSRRLERELEEARVEMALKQRYIHDITNTRTWRAAHFIKRKILRIGNVKPTDQKEA